MSSLPLDVLNNCRLCQLHPGSVKYTGDSAFINKVFECIRIKVIDDVNIDDFPKNVCKSCKLNIDSFHNYICEVRVIDRNLRQVLQCDTQNTTQSDLMCSSCLCKRSTSESFKLCEQSYTKLDSGSCNSFINNSVSPGNHKCLELLSKVNIKEEIKEDANEMMTNNIGKFEREPAEINNYLGHTCTMCSESFKSKTALQEHQKSHQGFHCTFENCTKICTSFYTFRNHLMKHKGIKPYLCVVCGKNFLTKNSLTCHEKTHAKIKDYVCQECNIGFSVASNLRAHQKKHHEGIRFYCSQCPRVFITKSSLQRHELVHAGIKDYKCKSCHAAFYTNKELSKHQRYHEGVRLYKCEQCFKMFFEKHHLTIHIRVHTGERPYTCKVIGCGKSFTESQKLSRHIRARHPPLG